MKFQLCITYFKFYENKLNIIEYICYGWSHIEKYNISHNMYLNILIWIYCSIYIYENYENNILIFHRIYVIFVVC